jgi:hypothetical protein
MNDGKEFQINKPVPRMVAALLLFFAGTALLFAHAMGKPKLMSALDSLPKVCPLRIILGLKCAFCGMTHAFLHLAFFDWRNAFLENALSIPFAAILLFATGAVATGSGRFADAFLSARFLRWGSFLSVLVLVAYAILRNVPL